MTNETQKPISKIRDGALEISIWGNQTEKGVRYSTNGVVRSYKEGDEWKKTWSLSGREHLASARLHEMAYTKILELRAADKEAAAPEAS